MKIIIVCIIILCLFLASVIINIAFCIAGRKRYIDIFNDNVIEILLNNNYNSLEIKRKIQLNSFSHMKNIKKIPLEMEYNPGMFVSVGEDFIEVYGIKNKNEYLIYKKNCSIEEIKVVKNIVDEINIKLSNINDTYSKSVF
jgi:hypothetical protein